ncbi:MAG: GreA/GreB family elongation factor [Lentisphaeria bacterium]
MLDEKNEELEKEFDALCLAAVENSPAALEKLLIPLRDFASQVPAKGGGDITQYLESMELVAESFSGNPYSELEIKFLELALSAGFDSATFRDRYVTVCKQLFNHYGNPAGLAEAIGIRDSDTPLDVVCKRMEVMKELQVGAFCHDPAFGTGTILVIDDLANEVTVSLDRKRILRLRSFFDSMVIIRKESALHSLLSSGKKLEKGFGKQFWEDLKSSLLCVSGMTNAVLKKILIPGFLTEEGFDMMAAGNFAQNVHDEQQSTTEISSSDAKRWDNSRSIDELVERLKNCSKLKVDQANLENVRNIFASVAHRPEQSESFALAAAMILKGGGYDEFLDETLKALAEEAEIWENIKLFVEICDKLPGKLVSYWLNASLLAKGSVYLVEATLLMPYRLWGHVEKLLSGLPEEKNLFSERVYQAFKEGRVTPEHYFWLWKAPKCELRSKYLSNSYLLFKTLHAEARGNYLKSRRTLQKMLVDDEQFQREVMNMGDTDAIKALVRCVKHQPLLDNSERQSLLVKIVRHYPDSIREVEEKGRAPRRVTVNITSIRSYERTKKELEDLINVLIPENVSAIEHARSLGDLRENSEFKFAKERQAFLSKQRAELENRLNETRPVDFSDVTVDVTVVPGCSVTFEYPSGKQEQFCVLGRFDSKPEENKIAFDSPLGKVLVGANVGDELKLPSGENAILKAINPLSKELLDWLNSIPA